MREIKFRCWHSGKMIYQGELVENKGVPPFFATPDFMFRHISNNRLMQYIGLKDIYESDIVSYNGERFIVEWDSRSAKFSLAKIFPKEHDTEVSLPQTHWEIPVDGTFLTVIGNTFQNPELIQCQQSTPA